MAKFIKLTENTNSLRKVRIINVDIIQDISQASRSSDSYMKLKDGSYLFTVETLDQIWEMIKDVEYDNVTPITRNMVRAKSDISY